MKRKITKRKSILSRRKRLNPDNDKEKTDDLMIYFDGRWIVEKYDIRRKMEYYDKNVLSIFRSDIPSLIKALEKEQI